MVYNSEKALSNNWL